MYSSFNKYSVRFVSRLPEFIYHVLKRSKGFTTPVLNGVVSFIKARLNCFLNLYRVEPRCPMDQKPIDKDAVSI